MNKRTLLTAVIVFSLSGCSLLPYEEASSCNMKKNYGKCIDVNGAYEEAVTGEDSGAPKVYKASEGPDETNNKDDGSPTEKPETPPYQDYQDGRYKVLSELIKKPVAPMLSPPKTVRTLVISYSPKTDDKTLYMPRYIYSIIEDSKFILGQYLKNKDQSLHIFEAE